MKCFTQYKAGKKSQNRDLVELYDQGSKKLDKDLSIDKIIRQINIIK